MTLQERLNGICEMATKHYEEDGEERPTWRVGEPGGLGIGSEAAAAAIIEAGEDQIQLLWYRHSGRIIVSVTTSAMLPGTVIDMTILAAAWPEGDFQIADALDAIL